MFYTDYYTLPEIGQAILTTYQTDFNFYRSNRSRRIDKVGTGMGPAKPFAIYPIVDALQLS